MMSDDLERYARQMRYAPLGEAGQRALSAARVLLVGCGALGSVLANTLVRAGVGFIRLVDRDFLELNNLQRQVLFDEADVSAALPKAVAAAEKLRRINSSVTVEPIVADVSADNLATLAQDVHLLLDGTDNFETRFLLNDYAVRHGCPWVYGGCLGAEGQTMTIVPGETPCLRCVIPEPPAPGTTPTCDTAGIVGPIINVIASIQALEAIKLLTGHRETINRGLAVIDLWEVRFRQLKLDNLRGGDALCPCCGAREFPWLEGGRGSRSAVLCGRNAVQISPPGGERLDLDDLQRKLESVGRVTRNPFLLRAAIGDYLLTIFPDGRAIIGGTDDPAEARGVYAKFIGV